MAQPRTCRLVQRIESDLSLEKHSYNDGDSRKSFISAPRLKEIWRTVSIPELFIHAKWNSEQHESVRSDFAKTISILIQIKWPRLREDFESLFFNEPGRRDADLPFSINCLDFLDQSYREDFFATQYTHMPFVIEEGEQEKDLPDQIVLPFDANPVSVGQGSFGKVYMVKIPSGCLRYRATENGGQLNNKVGPIQRSYVKSF